MKTKQKGQFIGYTCAPILVIKRLLTLKKITVLGFGVDLNHHL
jgi:hypothetical protein